MVKYLLIFFLSGTENIRKKDTVRKEQIDLLKEPELLEKKTLIIEIKNSMVS